MKKYNQHIKKCKIDNCIDCLFPNFLTRVTIDNYIIYANRKGICIEKKDIYINNIIQPSNRCDLCGYYQSINNKTFTAYNNKYKLCCLCSILHKKISSDEKQIVEYEKNVTSYITTLNIPLDICNIINVYFGNFFV
jgi:hypothetical protein